MRKNKLIFAGNNTLFTEAIRYVLERETDFYIETKSNTDAATIRAAISEKPELIVINQQQPDAMMVQMLREIRRRWRSIHILFIVQEATGELFSLAGETAGIGVMVETASLAEFKEAVHAVSCGERYIGKGVISNSGLPSESVSAEDPLQEITPREREVLYWLAHGLTNMEISKRMILSEKTVKNHVSHMLKKLGVTDRTKAAALAWREGLPLISEEFFSLYTSHTVLK